MPATHQHRLLDERFGLRSGDQRTTIDLELHSHEARSPDDILDRFVLQSPLKERAKSCELILTERLVKSCVQFDPLTAQSMGKQKFDIEAGLVKPVTLKMIDGELHQVPDSPRLGLLLKRHDRWDRLDFGRGAGFFARGLDEVGRDFFFAVLFAGARFFTAGFFVLEADAFFFA